VYGSGGKLIEVLCGTQEQHISADVAYAVWQYWQATGDDGFLLDAGAEIILETARFWASRAAPEADGRRHIRGVIGPDEYHETVDDNAYTNGMARWNLHRGLDVASWLRQRWPERWADLGGRLALDDAELALWRVAADTLATGFDAKTGLFEQFAGFHDLEAIDLAPYAGRDVPLDVVLGRDRTQRAQVVKQADVVALLALLPGDFDRRTTELNFQHYEPMCGHGSTLSRAMHALVAARLGDTEMALRYFQTTAAIDLADLGAVSAGGVHVAALGGLWQVAMFGFVGLSLHGGTLAFDPHLPVGWHSLGFRVQWRGRRLKVRIERDDSLFYADLEAGEPMTVFVGGSPHELRPGHVLRLP
jgi:trehalose/maltose hydrolase-like predicted phosphorylase